ncbi:ATP-binding protein [Streptomyces flavofungini]|uniref:ATP-binding protein n=1 Tax=Streptomyces flavofungini TaxID=68200 RepID=UPI0025B137C6|nr:ATP-binding protein [Streptomyces flavofungini]WJV51022.1 ATP-binding protein [Streptomyces flavofungini]
MTPFVDHVGNVSSSISTGAPEARPAPDARAEHRRGGRSPGSAPPAAAAEASARHTEAAPDGRGTGRPTGFRALRLRLPAVVGAVPGARHRVRRSLIEWGWADQADTVELLFCELLSNAVKHTPKRPRGAEGTETVEVSVRQGHEWLLVTVDDAGSTGTPAVSGCPARSDAPVDGLAENGRGLLLVEAMASAWGCRRTRKGTSTWFTLDFPGS